MIHMLIVFLIFFIFIFLGEKHEKNMKTWVEGLKVLQKWVEKWEKVEIFKEKKYFPFFFFHIYFFFSFFFFFSKWSFKTPQKTVGGRISQTVV